MENRQLTCEYYFECPVYALIIGINYVYDKEEKDNSRFFHKLNCAEQDALDFKQYLTDKFVPDDCIINLIGKEATLVEIKKGLAKHRRTVNEYCKENPINSKKPLSIIFFSGHAEMEDKKLYLIPYDAEKNMCGETALDQDKFDGYLKDLETDKLVVFLDACHSGGAAAKSGGGVMFDPKTFGDAILKHENMGDGKGRYIITSCDEGEWSYEGEKNGIFTGQLLELLKCQGDDIIEKEQINVLDLYQKLEKKVSATALHLKNVKQTPTLKVLAGQQPIILGVNERKKQELADQNKVRLALEIKNKKELFEYISEEIKKKKFNGGPTLSWKLEEYLLKGVETSSYYAKIYPLINDLYDLWCQENHNIDALSESCSDLIKCFGEIFKTPSSPNNPLKSGIHQPVAPDLSAGNPNATEEKQEVPTTTSSIESNSDLSDSRIEKKIDNTIIQSEIIDQTPGILQTKNETIKNMVSHKDHIFEPLFKADISTSKSVEINYCFDKCLARGPVSKESFKRALSKILSILTSEAVTKEDEAITQEIMNDVAKRFDERWKEEKSIEISSPLGIRINR